MVAARSRWKGVCARLDAQGIALKTARAERRLLWLDAAEGRDGLTIDGKVSVDGFRTVLQRFIEPKAKQRIYGELVSLLAARGDAAATVAIERRRRTRAPPSYSYVVRIPHRRELAAAGPCDQTDRSRSRQKRIRRSMADAAEALSQFMRNGMLGRKPSDLEGKRIAEIMGDEGFATIRPFIDRCWPASVWSMSAKSRLRAWDDALGRVVYMPDRDADGSVVGRVASLVDVTAERHTSNAPRMAVTSISR